MLVEDEKKSITYVNAGHVPPILVSKSKNCVTRLNTGGFLTGFIGEAEYEKESVNLEPGDIIAVFTDGVPEVANREDQDYGEEAMIDFIKKNSHLSAAQLTDGLLDEMLVFSEGKAFRDDFTLIILKVK
jgi:sigma-B regulation protein RsbU (phosphoserine phosphatase)